MKTFRIIAIVATQAPLIYFELGSRDLLGGFNQTSEGFFLMVGLFVAVPLLNLAWLVLEAARSFRMAREKGCSRTILLPLAPLIFVAEAIAIDLYLLGHVRM